jgi:acyl-CoA thioesterase FadM
MAIYLRTEPIIPAWTDYNGHMNLAFYIHLFDQGWDVLLDKFQMVATLQRQRDDQPLLLSHIQNISKR